MRYHWLISGFVGGRGGLNMGPGSFAFCSAVMPTILFPGNERVVSVVRDAQG